VNTTANAAQKEYWNTIAGPHWVGLEGFVERRVQAVNDLLLTRSGVAAGERVLEVGCGTGAFTVPLAAAIGGRGEVLGADISAAMLASARKRLGEAGLSNVTLTEADAQTHEFEPDRFDLIAWRFGVNVLCRSEGGFRQSVASGAAPRSAVFCLLGTARGQLSLAYPLRGGAAPSRSARAETAPCSRSDGIRRPGLLALVSRRRRVRGNRDAPRDAGCLRLDPAGGSRACSHHGPIRPAD
jgi:SAM-dependent methyltransferase